MQAGWIESLVIFHGYSSLTLDHRGFTIKAPPWGKRHYAWDEVEKFAIIDSSVVYGRSSPFATMRQKVLFYTMKDKEAGFLKAIYKSLFSYLPFHYGFTPKQLAQLMNHWRERALQVNSADLSLQMGNEITFNKVP